MATRDLALALVSQAMAAHGDGSDAEGARRRGADQGASLALAEDDARTSSVARPHCDLALADPDASREHVLRDRARGAPCSCATRRRRTGRRWATSRVADDRDVPWRPTIMVRIGRTVLALDEPVRHALADLERAPDEPLRGGGAVAAAPSVAAAAPSAAEGLAANASPGAATPPKSLPPASSRPAKERPRWSVADLLVDGRGR